MAERTEVNVEEIIASFQKAVDLVTKAMLKWAEAAEAALKKFYEAIPEELFKEGLAKYEREQIKLRHKKVPAHDGARKKQEKEKAW